MNVNIHNRTLALAGLFQAVRLVQQTARGEPRDKDMTAASIGSIFNTDPASVVDVYGDIEAVRTGLELLVQQLGNDNKRREVEVRAIIRKHTVWNLRKRLFSIDPSCSKRSSVIDVVYHNGAHKSKYALTLPIHGTSLIFLSERCMKAVLFAARAEDD